MCTNINLEEMKSLEIMQACNVLLIGDSCHYLMSASAALGTPSTGCSNFFFHPCAYACAGPKGFEASSISSNKQGRDMASVLQERLASAADQSECGQYFLFSIFFFFDYSDGNSSFPSCASQVIQAAKKLPRHWRVSIGQN